MKRLIKYAALIFALMLAASIIGGCLTAGVAVVQMIVEKTEDAVEGNRNNGDGNGIWYRDDNGDVVFLGIHFGNSGDVKSGSETFSGSDITSLDLEGLSGQLTVEVWDGDAVSVVYENIPEDYEIYVDNGTLTIEREGGIFIWGTSFTETPKIQVQVPAGQLFKNVIVEKGSGSARVTGIAAEYLKVDSGSGAVNVSGATVEELRIDSGSGSVVVESVMAEKTVVDSGSGAVRMKNSDLGETSVDTGSGLMNFEEVTTKNLVVDSGSGRVDYAGYLVGNCVFDTASGSVSLEIYGAEEDYNIRADLGSGGFYINGDKEKDTEIKHAGADNLLVFDAGSGKVSVNFREELAKPETEVAPETESSENYDRSR